MTTQREIDATARTFVNVMTRADKEEEFWVISVRPGFFRSVLGPYNANEARRQYDFTPGENEAKILVKTITRKVREGEVRI